ncbi:MAG: type II toxin-antitoxin system RelE/ParE family toxin [Candidatus Margulisiibacteriota bacterium]
MVIWTYEAEVALQRIYDYIAHDSKYHAERVAENLVRISEALADFPLKGRIVPEVNREEIREMLVYSYRLIYTVTRKEILIIQILNQKQELNTDLF